MKSLLSLFILACICSAKIVDTTVSSNGPDIASQFCFPTGKGTIGIEAETPLLDQKIAVLEILSTAEVTSILSNDGCKKLETEAIFLFSLARIDHAYYNLIEINSSKEDVCVTVVAIRCSEPSTPDQSVEVSLYIEYLNDGVSSWNVGLSLEDQGLPTLMCFFALAMAAVLIIFWKLYCDIEQIGVHPDLLMVSKVVYGSLLLSVMSWTWYYLLYVSSGNPPVLIKAIGCYSQWVFELSVLVFLALHGTGHFIKDTEPLSEVKVILAIDAVITLYYAFLKSVESEDVVEFHWFCWSTAMKWSRILAATVVLLWSIKGYEERPEKEKETYSLLAYGGLLWAYALPVTIWLTKFLLRFRWKFYQALLSITADIAFAAFLLVFLHPERATVLFARENVVQSLKGDKTLV